MSYPQAFHTSCRTGITGGSGFQVNASSVSLDREQLAAMSRAHARYETPNDLPYEPTPAEIATFPVSLKVNSVAGVGVVVSRTAYVGREYRGRDGSPDEGRFGNYFCHMVVGASGDDPFDGLSAVELWDAPHWTTTESQTTTLPPLSQLEPGTVVLDDVLAVVASAPDGVAEKLVDAALRSVNGGDRLLVVDPIADRAVTWIAWLSFVLPPRTASRLTFSTFEGRPQDVLDLHVVATTPACSPGVVVGSSPIRVDVSEPTTAGGCLYARAAVRLAEEGPEALASAVRKVGEGDLAEQGASLAIAGGVTDLVGDDDLPAVLAQLQAQLDAGRTAAVARAAERLAPSSDGDRQAIGAWAALHRAARMSQMAEDDAIVDLATVALGRVLGQASALSVDTPAVPFDAPVVPGVSAIGTWLRATEDAKGTDKSGSLLRLGQRLGLIGLNVPVDNRIAAVIAHDFDRPSMLAAVEVIGATGQHDDLLEQVTEVVLSASPRAGTQRAQLAELSRYPAARDVIRRRADELHTFDAVAAWQHTRIATDPTVRPDAARALAELATDREAEAEIRELWGDHGPRTETELAELIQAYNAARRAVPLLDLDRAFKMLMSSALPTGPPPATNIWHSLTQLPADSRKRPEFYAYFASAEVPGWSDTTLTRWAEYASYALRVGASRIPPERWAELVARVGSTLARERASPEFVAALEELRGAAFEDVLEAAGRSLASRVKQARNRSEFASKEFDFWIRVPIPRLVDYVLPTAFQPLSARDRDAVAELVSEPAVKLWEEWCARHPRSGARAAVGRMMGRRRAASGDDA